MNNAQDDLESSSSISTCYITTFGLCISLRTILLLVAAATYILTTLVLTLTTYRVLQILTRPKPPQRRNDGPNDRRPRGRHLLIVLGSGGHTAEMLSILQNLGAEYLNTRFARRTYVVSSGDSFSAERAKHFEWTLSTTPRPAAEEAEGYWTAGLRGAGAARWDIVTVRRARRVHQSLWSTPVSALRCLWDCILVLRGTHADLVVVEDKHRHKAEDGAVGYPDLILTNGPGTGVIVVLTSLILLFLGLAPLDADGSMRSVYVESWARVKTLSLSGKILRWMVGRFLVQWPGLATDDATLLVTAAPSPPSERVSEEEEKEAKGAIDSPEPMSTSGYTAKTTLPRSIEYIGAVVT